MFMNVLNPYGTVKQNRFIFYHDIVGHKLVTISSTTEGLYLRARKQVVL